MSPPIDLPPSAAARRFSRADLVFYGVDARNASYTARVFLQAPTDQPRLSPDRKDGYAGFFTIFGHGGCFGDVGHCDVPAQPQDPFDTRPPHAMTPHTKIVDITDALKQASGDAIVVTVLAVVPGQDTAVLADELSFERLALLVYD